MNSQRLRQVLKTVDSLYEAACDPGKWSAFLRSAAELFEAQGAQIGHHDLRNHTLSFSRLHGYEWSDSHYRRYDELMPTDPRLPYFAQNPFVPVHCRMHLSDEELHRTRVYQEILEPGGVEYSLGVNLVEDTRSLSYFLALRNKSQNQFDGSDCDLMSELIPHLNRAIILQRDIGTIDFERNVAANTLDNMAIGVIVVSSSSKIMFSNATAQEILQDLDGMEEVSRAKRIKGACLQPLILSYRRLGQEMLFLAKPFRLSATKAWYPCRFMSLRLWVKTHTQDGLGKVNHLQS